MTEFKMALDNKVFLILLLKNPKQALSVNGIKVDETKLRDLERLASSEIEHWKTAVFNWNKAKAANDGCVVINELDELVANQ